VEVEKFLGPRFIWPLVLPLVKAIRRRLPSITLPWPRKAAPAQGVPGVPEPAPPGTREEVQAAAAPVAFLATSASTFGFPTRPPSIRRQASRFIPVAPESTPARMVGEPGRARPRILQRGYSAPLGLVLRPSGRLLAPEEDRIARLAHGGKSASMRHMMLADALEQSAEDTVGAGPPSFPARGMRRSGPPLARGVPPTLPPVAESPAAVAVVQAEEDDHDEEEARGLEMAGVLAASPRGEGNGAGRMQTDAAHVAVPISLSSATGQGDRRSTDTGSSATSATAGTPGTP
jgi:hypothetical protein